MFLVEYYNDILWHMVQNGLQMKEKLNEAMKKVGYQP